MNSPSSAELQPLVSRNAYDDAVSFALRQFVGRGKRFTSAAKLEGPTGVPWRVIEAAKAEPGTSEHRHLPADKLLSLAGVLGPEFLTLCIAPTIQQGAYWLPETDPLPPGQLAADLADDSAAVTRAAIDGEFDRDERPGLRVVGRRMMARGAALALAA